MSSPLIKKPIVDKNGKATTVSVRADGGASDNKRVIPAPVSAPEPQEAWVDDDEILLARVQKAYATLDSKLTELLGEDHELTFTTVNINPDQNNPKIHPGFTAVDVNFTVPGTDSEGKPSVVGASAIFRATDIHFIEGDYVGLGWGTSDDNKERFNAVFDAALPEIREYHNAMFEFLNKREIEPVRYVATPEEARAFLLDFAGYEPYHEQGNERLLGMCHKIAQVERMAHHMPEIFAAVDVLESASGRQIVNEYNERQYAHNRDMYKRLRANG